MKRRTSSPATARRPRQLWVPIAISTAAIATAAIGWLVTQDRDEPADEQEELGVAHVHGLGINPADGTLHVATHNGTFRIPDDGAAQRVGDSFQDTMGFTVAGPDTFLGSGHPDVAGSRAGQPGLLGLIESTDAGETWQSVSLSGEVDFHALALEHDRVYGWDSTSGRFMVSTDRQTWDVRATLDLYGFAVDPDDPESLVAAGPGGTRASADGGRTWTAPGEPQLIVVDWAPGGSLWGAGPSGILQRSDDGGDTWTQTGQLPGEPQSLLATDDGLWAAAHQPDGPTGLYRSTDGGQSWRLRYQDDIA